MGILDELYIRKKIRKILQEKKNDDKKSTDPKGQVKIEVTVGDLSARDGVYYMVHTLNGGVNAGSLDLGSWNANIDKGGAGAIVTLTDSASGEKGGKVKRGKVGRGGVAQAVKEAGALATDKPEELMKRLGNPKASGDTLPEKVLNFIRTSIYGNKTMVKAYSGARMIKSSSEKED